LTIDPKNELSIDPSTIGLPPNDELAVEALATRQSYLTTVNWTTSTAVDTPLFTATVSPAMFNYTNSSFYMTPMDMVRRLFLHWRGDIIFTFKIIASKYHKGRLRISYDPSSGGVQTTGDTGPFVHNQIVDIGQETSVDVRIPYQQALAWLYSDPTVTTLNYSTSTTPALTYSDVLHNGVLSVKVLTLLTAPVASSSVPLLILVRAAENFEVANPTSLHKNLSLFALQGTAEEVGEEIKLGTRDEKIMATRGRVYMGETVRSLRHLLRRSNLVDYVTTASTDTGFKYLEVAKYPPFYGYDTNGWQQARNQAGTANVKFNWTQTTPWHFIMPCFIGQKGSLHWQITTTGTGTPNFLQVMRANDRSITTIGQFSVPTAATPYSLDRNVWNSLAPTLAGAAVTQGRVQPVLNFAIPNYTMMKFQACKPSKSTLNTTSGSDWDGSDREGYQVVSDLNGVSAAASAWVRHFSVGTDYNLYFFLCVPTWINYPGTPGAST
jgi:hypothetical protein